MLIPCADSPTSSITDKKALESLDTPSDLVLGVYEDGMKIRECGLYLCRLSGWLEGYL
jgi:hypothetical protein